MNSHASKRVVYPVQFAKTPSAKCQVKSGNAIRIELLKGWLGEMRDLVTRIETTIDLCERGGCGEEK